MSNPQHLEGVKQRSVEVTFEQDGDDLELYVDGWYLCNVAKDNLSDQACEVLGIEAKDLVKS